MDTARIVFFFIVVSFDSNLVTTAMAINTTMGDFGEDGGE
jgi:hypothetical protein